MIAVYIIIAILILLLMITIHEAGHYFVGRWLGFRITEFAIGFGPKIWSKVNKRGEIISIRALPLGGFCSFYGEDGLDEEKKEEGKEASPKPPTDESQFFTNQKPWKRILVFFAGVTANFLSAIVFSFILLVATGYGNGYRIDNINEHFVASASAENQITELQQGDRITHIDGVQIDYIWEKTVENLVVNEDGNSYTLTIVRANVSEPFEINIQVQTGIEQYYNEETKQYEDKLDDQGVPSTYTGLGLALAMTSTPVPVGQALWQCFSLTVGFAWLVIKTLFLLFTFQLPLSSLGGTATVISTLATSMGTSLSVILVYLPLIAVNLAVFNALPFPALDGAHAVFTGIEWARGKPIKREVEATIHFVGLIILFAFVIFLDLYHFFG